MHTNHFENSPLKHEIRRVICEQIIDGALLTKTPIVSFSSLPGRNWNFESRLQGLADMSGISLTAECYEADPEIYYNGNAYVDTGDGQTSAEIGAHTFSYRNDFFRYDGDSNVVWADYCGNPRAEFLNDFIYYANHRKGWALCYATFSLSVRQMSVLPLELLNAFSEHGGANIDWKERAQAVAQFLLTRIKTPHRLIFSYLYSHAGHGNRMFTIGVELHPTKKTIAKLPGFEFESIAKPSAPAYQKFEDEGLARAVFQLREVDGMPVAKVAETLGITGSKIGGIRVSLLYKKIKKEFDAAK